MMTTPNHLEFHFTDFHFVEFPNNHMGFHVFDRIA